METGKRNFKDKKLILTLDLGLKTGYAIGTQGKLLEHGMLKLPNKQKGDRYFFFGQWLAEKHKTYNFQKIVFELVNFIGDRTSPCSAHAYGGYKAILESFAYANQISIETLTVREIKQAFAEKSNCGKEKIIQKVNEHGFKVTDDNEADALAIFLLTTKDLKNDYTTRDRPN